MFALILIDYWAALCIERSEGKQRKLYLIISIISTCVVLFAFKYFNFFNSNIAAAARFLHLNYPIEALQIILPIGLSFHTFQSLSYVIEVYRKHQKAERNLGIYALYVMFYPQLVAGPIERPQNLLHQFYERHHFEYQRVTDGLKLMAWGMFKKVVISDRLGFFVGTVYDDPHGPHGLGFAVATIFFAFQIYCDFSGYSDIAVGSAQVMGFKLMNNFNRPYSARSVAEFWQRWHISLSTWFKDYVYIPLGGNRLGEMRTYRNLLFTFLLSGIWHGANWTYIVWGALNGFYMVFGMATKEARARLVRTLGLDRQEFVYRYVQISATFALICFAWIFFRAQNINDALYIAGHLWSGLSIPAEWRLKKTELCIAVTLIVFLVGVQSLQKHTRIRPMLAQKSVALRWMVYYAFISTIVLSVLFRGDYQRPFIYFQF